ncbi:MULTISPECIES: TIGR03557 family F420-dependent LLM class oxidoreductase [Streptomyces]|uniref:TIGR03557 family F420-dependent LLM class oxidoreductase n=1 Tax=Streptomyces cinereoruber TaxID=67260 RepID=A0ABX6BQE2_9ACTN|nr:MULTISPECIES: TIGR03557 family F420-dependent LLM class oxidoreductase [Streptomyces]AVH94208.1 TIGR03557 family F420-dependent LLM class oxidoreductase [Streptomyces sp. WAC00288]KYG51370.1 LLM class F420-dependent oxidoreductase [Streptomyces sp. WAC04657]MBY8819210.1 TIGR03557 family F420-dependent LLM class oxidoreductase [Streptomyces cinereoruber]QEV36046.1 TIGR03557 family F420-dependent LLM class oxidoreductase [Streptomyces cinereoruber]
MVKFGYMLMTEQSGPRELVAHSAAAERAGFDFELISDHYSPWLKEQGHAAYAWSVLGAITQATERVELMTYVTAPIMRYHPAVVAQKAATVGLLSGDRFTLGLGSGENLNEHVVGAGWPSVTVRHEMLSEALEIIRSLLDGDLVNFTGKHYQVDSAKLWDLPQRRVPIATAISGERSIHRFAPASDAMIAIEPKAWFCPEWDSVARETGQRKIGQIAVAWDTDRDAAVQRAWEKMRWFAGGWKLNTELRSPAAFAAAARGVQPDDVAGGIPCGAAVEPIVAAARTFWEAGFTDVAISQIGVDKDPQGFFRFAETELLPALREAATGR